MAFAPRHRQHGAMLEFLLMVVGLVGLGLGSGLVVRGAVLISQRLRISPLVVGLTVTAVGTSIPEIATNVSAAIDVLRGVPASGIAIGNVIGSCLSQITLLLGVAGLAGVLTCPRRSLRRDGGMLVVAMLAMLAACLDGTLDRLEGGALVLVYLAYLVGVVIQEREEGAIAPEVAAPAPKRGALWWAMGSLAFGLAVVVGSAELAVGSAVTLAQAAGVDNSLLGLGVGLGTGLPELVISVQALRSQAGMLGLGNLLGSNITDPLLSIGLGALVSPLAVPPIALAFDFPAWIAATAVALLLLFNHLDLSWRESCVLLVVFGLFVWVRTVVLLG
jgi:cation:H+ antiporter